MNNLRNALGYLDGARFANYSGQIMEQKDGKDHLRPGLHMWRSRIEERR